MNYIVYKTTNLINGKIYVGVHKTNPEIFDGYLGCGVSKKDQKKKTKGFPKAVQKYGYENFKRETLFIFPDTEEGKELAYKKESEIVNVDFIKRIDTYNLSVGGIIPQYEHSREIAQYTLEGKFIRVWNSIKEAEESLNLTSIIGNLKGQTKYCGNFQWRYYDGSNDDISPVSRKEKSVYQFDLQGNLIKCWKSIAEASSMFSSNAAKTAIWNVCNGKSNQAYGYFWSYKNKFIPKVNNHLAPVAKYNDDGIFIESYSSVKEAADSNNIKTPANIIAAIKGTQKRCGGFRWRYFYGNTDNIKPL